MSEEKLNRIILLLEDENIGLCGRVKRLEKTVNGNGELGLAESVRNNNRNWAGVVTIVTLVISIFFKYF